jgi:Tol biopolymer transport system component
MTSSALVVLAGTKRAWRPFWSPDSQSVAFFHPDGLKQVTLVGGAVRVLADSTWDPFVNMGGTWQDGTILFVDGDRRLYSVAASGGTPRPLDVLSKAQGHFVSPSLLPDGRHFLLSIENEPGVYVASVEAPGIRKLVDDASTPVYRAGHLFYSRGTALLARPFRAERLEFSGPEVRVTDQGSHVSDELSVSPDGRWVAFNSDESGRWEVYVAEFPAFTSKRQISESGGVQPQWRADGREFFYLASDGSLMSARVDTRGGLTLSTPSRLFSTRFATNPHLTQYAVTADGQRVLGIERATDVSHFTFLLNWLGSSSNPN